MESDALVAGVHRLSVRRLLFLDGAHPADTAPLPRPTKQLMTGQAAISLMLVALIIGRSINII
jgi:hypothetical protein